MNNAKLDTIRKLIAKATGTTNPNEASIFMNKAQAMMAEEGVDMEAIDLSAIKQEEVKSRFSVSKIKIYENTLMHGIAEAFGCQLMWMKNRSWGAFGEDNYARFIFVGPKDRLSLATYAAEVLGRQLAKARAKFAKDLSDKMWAIVRDAEPGRSDWMVKDDYSSQIRKEVSKRADSFAAGWAYEIRKKVVAFALNDKEQALLETYIKNNAGKADEQKQPKLDAAAFHAGIAAAKDESLHRPITGQSDEGHLLGQTLQLSHGG